MAKYTPKPEDIQKIQGIFQFHPVNGDQPERYAENRQAFEDLGLLLLRNCPPSRELSLAITSLQQAMNYANGAIAINEVPDAKL